jgi:hypothetical protein
MFSSACVRLRKEASGVDRSQGCRHCMRHDLVKEISQTWGGSASRKPARDLA